MEIRAISAPWYDGVEFLIRDNSSDGTIAIVAEMKMTAVEPNMAQPPTGRISRQAAQVLMDDLWAAGLRPSEGSGSAGSLRATERHLEDMRRIVATKLNVPLVTKP